MANLFFRKVVNVFIALRYFLIIIFLMLQACHSSDDKDDVVSNKTDLNKAATFNVQLGLGYLKQGDRPRAKKKLLTAMAQEPNSPDVNAALAYYFEHTSENDQAKKYYLKAISLSANSGTQLNNYGTFLCRQGDFKNAEVFFLKAVKDENYVHTSGAYENAGLCAIAVPDNEKAKFYFNQALSQDPSRRVALYELVKLESKENHDNEAFNLLQRYPDLVINDKIFLDLAKNIAVKAGKYEVAAQYESSLNKLMRSNVDNGEANDEYNSHTG